MTTSKISQLINMQAAIKEKSEQNGAVGYLNQEILRFITISSAIINLNENNRISIGENPDPDSRAITHPLVRSLFEGFFKNLYIFNDPEEIENRYSSLLQEFCTQYEKMKNEPLLSIYQLPNLATNSAVQGTPLPNIASMVSKISDEDGTKLKKIYAWYRIASFDTHTQACENLVTAALEHNSAFPFIKVGNAIDMMAEKYLELHQKNL